MWDTQIVDMAVPLPPPGQPPHLTVHIPDTIE